MKTIKIEWYLLGAELANLSDEEQSEFFKGFANEIDSWSTHSAKQEQMSSVSIKLDDRTKKILNTYLPTIYFKGD